MDTVHFRSAGPSDAATVAALHAASWRRHYRGAYSDAYLDGEAEADRLAVWTARLDEPGPGDRTVLAEGPDGAVGFVHAVLDADPAWGTLVDNLHVTRARQGHGIGTSLLGLAARAVDDAHHPGLHLWVLEQNLDAQAFYRARGGTVADRRDVSSPGGVPGRLAGAPVALRMTWSRPAELVRSD